MLVLSRRAGERIRIGDVIITVIERRRTELRIGIEAPPGIAVERLPAVGSARLPAGDTGTVSPASRVPGEPGVKGQPGSAGQGGSPCPHHDATACCTQCPGHAATDGLGFPHPHEAKGRRRLRRCVGCRLLRDPSEWTHDIDRARFGCRSCYPCPP